MSRATPPGTRDFQEFYEQLESEVPQLAEARQTQQDAEAFTRAVREQLVEARGSLPQTEVAQRMGLKHQSRVSRIEKGEGDLTLEALYRYARAIGLEPQIVLTPAEAGETDEAQASEALGEALTQIQETQERLNEQMEAFHRSVQSLRLLSSNTSESFQRPVVGKTQPVNKPKKRNLGRGKAAAPSKSMPGQNE